MKYSSNYSKIEIFLKDVTVNIFLFFPSQLGRVQKKNGLFAILQTAFKLILCDQRMFFVEHLFYALGNVHRRNKENIHSGVQNMKCRLR